MMSAYDDRFNLQILPKDVGGVAHDLTGNTLVSSSRGDYDNDGDDNGMVVDERRLSISEYNVGRSDFYEYEFLNSNRHVQDQDYDRDDMDVERDVKIDERMFFGKQFPLHEVQTFDDVLVSSPKKKMMNYFKFSWFNNNLLVSKNNKKSRTTSFLMNNDNNDDALTFVDDDNEYDNDDFYDSSDLQVQEQHLLINPTQLMSNTATNNDFASSDNIRIGEDPLNYDYESNTVNSIPTTELHNETNKIVPKKMGTTMKTRGRKPSPVLDLSKHFACEFCERRFKRQEHLKRHVRSLHMGEKPYSCYICDKNFSRSDNLSQHIKTHTHPQ